MIAPKRPTVTTPMPIFSNVVRPPLPVFVAGTVAVVSVATAGAVTTGVEDEGTPLSGLAASAPAGEASATSTASAARARAQHDLGLIGANIAATARASRRIHAMAPKQRQIRMEQQLISPQVMEQMQTRSDEQLESERKHRSVAYSILGARAAERYDAQAARSWFQKAMVASTHPQERLQIRRMADASLALAERRADDLKVAVEKLGQEAPSSRQLFGLRMMGLIAPPRGAHPLLRIRGALIVLGLIVALIAIGTGTVKLLGLAAGGIGWPPAVLLGLLLDIVVLAVLAWLGRRRQRAALVRAAR